MSVSTQPQVDTGAAGREDDADPAASAPVGGSDAPAAPDPAAPIARSAADLARRQGAWLLGARARTALLALLVLLVGVLLVKPASSGVARDFAATATSLTTAMSTQTGVTSSSGGYLPGTGIVLVSAVQGVTSTQLNGVLAAAMGPFAAQLADLPGGEAVSWQATLTGTDGTVTTWLIRVGADVVDDQSQWVAVPVAGGAAGGGTTSAAGSTPAAAGSAAAGTAAAGTAGAGATGAAGTSAAAPTTAAVATAAVGSGTTPGTDSAAGSAAGSTAATTAASATSAAGAVSGTQSDDFAGDASAWESLTGTWAVVDGTYQQSDASGYDYISQFTSTLPSAYTVSVKLKGLADTVNGGLIIGQPALGSRKGATIVDLASKDYIRWGSYDASSSTYKFTGGAALGAAQAASDWHTLSVTVKPDGSTVSWDGKQVGTFATIAPGFAGLVSSQSAVAFDDFTVTAS